MVDRARQPWSGFTFGCPAPDIVRALQAGGTLVAVTVTTPDEAALARDAGVDCLCLQGSEAGGHRGSFANDDRPGQDFALGVAIAGLGAAAGLTSF